METVIFNIALLPPPEFSRELVRASHLIGATQPLDYSLGENSWPHVTMLQFSGQRTEAEAIWARVTALNLPSFNLHFHGLAYERWRRWDGIWLRLKHCGPLRAAQLRAAREFAEREFENGVGDMYEPHATLAAWLLKPTMPNFEIPDGILDRTAVPVKPALGISGPQFQFAEKLFGGW